MHITLTNLGPALDLRATVHEVNERPECRRKKTSAWIIEVESRTRGTPVLQYPDQAPLCQLLRYVAFKRVGQSHSGKRRLHRQADIVYRQGTRYLDVHLFSRLAERPPIERAGLGPSVIEACMLGQVLRHRWYGIMLEIGRRSDDGGAKVRCQSDRYHVLMKQSAETNSRVIAAADDIGKLVLGGQFDMDVGIGGGKGRKYRSDQDLDAHARQVQANRARRAFTVNAQTVDGVFDFGKCRGQSGEQRASGIVRETCALCG